MFQYNFNYEQIYIKYYMIKGVSLFKFFYLKFGLRTLLLIASHIAYVQTVVGILL